MNDRGTDDDNDDAHESNVGAVLKNDFVLNRMPQVFFYGPRIGTVTLLFLHELSPLFSGYSAFSNSIFPNMNDFIECFMNNFFSMG